MPFANVGFFALPVSRRRKSQKKRCCSSAPIRGIGTLKDIQLLKSSFPKKSVETNKAIDVRPKHSSMYGIFIYFTIHFGPISHGKWYTYKHIPYTFWSTAWYEFIKLQGLNFHQGKDPILDGSITAANLIPASHPPLVQPQELWKIVDQGPPGNEGPKGSGRRGWLSWDVWKNPKNPGKTWGERGYTTWKVDGDRHSQCIGLSWPRLLIHLLGVEPSTFSTVWFLVFCTWSVKTDVSYCWCRKMYVLTCSCSSLSHCLCRFNTI